MLLRHDTKHAAGSVEHHRNANFNGKKRSSRNHHEMKCGQTVGSGRIRFRNPEPTNPTVSIFQSVLVRLHLRFFRVTVLTGFGLYGWFVSVSIPTQKIPECNDEKEKGWDVDSGHHIKELYSELPDPHS
ncbi:hypothetical protein MTR_5g098315 [Medicago truncatula]|uniref:Uncharacterized protein n=1 Tax=Medicago truncatula TaxID=3880 RepID=A0A072URJ0_MEDTR|nr:hypothetical protein MTR_5g098315 [Medicago truncatula]